MNPKYILTISIIFGWVFGEAYVTGPQKHYQRGYKAAQVETLEALQKEKAKLEQQNAK